MIGKKIPTLAFKHTTGKVSLPGLKEDTRLRCSWEFMSLFLIGLELCVK
jgi:hypothetical protein